MRRPSRRRGSAYGVFDIDSMPPATATLMSPVWTPCAASITARSPDPHTMFSVIAPTVGGSPARSAAWRAGAWPMPAETTLPMKHSSTWSGATPARTSASRMAIAPSSGALSDFSAPRNLPVGVRAALRMTAFCHCEVLLTYVGPSFSSGIADG